MNKALVLAALFFAASLAPSMAQAIDCLTIFNMAKSDRGAQAKCLMVEHTPGLQRGSVETTYVCGAAKYKLVAEEDGSCYVDYAR